MFMLKVLAKVVATVVLIVAGVVVVFGCPWMAASSAETLILLIATMWSGREWTGTRF